MKGDKQGALEDLDSAIKYGVGNPKILKQVVEAEEDLAMGAKFGNEVAKTAVRSNPYAKMCNAMVREAMASLPRDVFQTLFAVTYMPCNLASLCILLFVGKYFRWVHASQSKTEMVISPQFRIGTGFTLNTVVFGIAGILTLFADKIDASLYLGVTIIFIAASAFGAALIAAVFALASQYSALSTQGVSTGQGFAGLVPAVVVWLSQYSQSSLKVEAGQSAAKSFWISAFLNLVAGFAYYFLLRKGAPQSEANAAYEPVPDSEESAASGTDDAEAPADITEDTNRTEGGPVWKKIRLLAAAMFLNFVVTLGLFPSILTSVESKGGLNGTGMFIPTMRYPGRSFSE
ncbi:hypothetical protein HDU96_004988 [Phlyctochytrium bullatum]|nr:hypothetical protein HDU96_004988 [Phlyctochytrium bullatum]